MEAKSIGKFIATLRKANGYTQSQLAEQLGVSNKTISNWENEVSYPDLSLIPVIADLFNITSDELLRGAKNNNNVQLEKKSNEQYIETKTNKIKDNLKKNLMNKYSNQVYISLGILTGAYIFLFLGILLLKENNGIAIENEEVFGTISLIVGLLAYGIGLIFSIINSNNFLNKLDLEDDNSDLLFFQLKKNLLLKCLYGFVVLSPFFIYSYDQKILSDEKYNASEELKNRIRYNNKLKLKVGLIFTCIGAVISIGILVLNLLSIDKFELKKYDDSVLQNEGKFEVNVYNGSYTIKMLSELDSIVVHHFDYVESLPVESKIYEIKTFFESEEELEAFYNETSGEYYLDGFKIAIIHGFERMYIAYDNDVIIILRMIKYKNYIIYNSNDTKFELIDVGNNQFKCITSDTYYVRDIWFSFAYFTLIANIAAGFIVYFSKKKYNK